MLQRVLSRLRHHARRLRILNGFSFRRHRRIIDAQGARHDGVQRRDVLETLSPLHRLICDGGLQCKPLLCRERLSGTEPMVEFGGEVESAPGMVERVIGALIAMESAREGAVETDSL